MTKPEDRKRHSAYVPAPLTKRTRKIMVELAETMLRHVKQNPRQPGALSSGVDKGLFKDMDKSVNEREVQYWTNQVRVYKDAPVGV